MFLLKKSYLILIFCCCLLCSLTLFANPSPKLTGRAAFISKLLKISDQSNAEILQQRSQLLSLYQLKKQGKSLSSDQKLWVAKLAKSYRIKDWSPETQSDWQNLISRVDIVPSSLLLAQAAVESAWGTSRFAREGNNYFGEWCYQKGCGIVPRRRPKNATYEVEKFASPKYSVQSYIKNLNTNRSYRALREKRLALRQANEPVTGYALASGLSKYSQLGSRYVGIVRSVIKKYDLNKKSELS